PAFRGRSIPAAGLGRSICLRAAVQGRFLCGGAGRRKRLPLRCRLPRGAAATSRLEARPGAGAALGSGRLHGVCGAGGRITMATLVKTTLDGRKLEVVGLAITLGGKLEANELIEVKDHPNRRAIWNAVPEATHMAGRLPLTREEAEIVLAAFKKA